MTLEEIAQKTGGVVAGRSVIVYDGLFPLREYTVDMIGGADEYVFEPEGCRFVGYHATLATIAGDGR